MFKQLIGITFITVIADTFLNGTAYKKYIKAIIGLFLVITVVQGISGFKNVNPDFGILDEIESDIAKNIYYSEESIKKEMIKNAEINIVNTLKNKSIVVIDISLDIDNEYNITALNIKLADTAQTDKATDILINELYIDKSVIKAG